MQNIVFFILVFVLCSANLNAQVSGFKGSKLQLEVNYSPNIGIRLAYDNSEVSYTDVSEHVLIGGDKGIGRVTLYESLGLSGSYVVSRSGTLGVQYSKSKMLTTWENYYNNNLGYELVALEVKSILVKYDKYFALAPLKRYVRFGIGIDQLGHIDDENGETWDTDNKFLFFTVGLGGNSFITDHIYFNLGLDVNISSAGLRSLDGQVGGNTRLYNAQGSLFNAKLLKLQLGIGVNI